MLLCLGDRLLFNSRRCSLGLDRLLLQLGLGSDNLLLSVNPRLLNLARDHEFNPHSRVLRRLFGKLFLPQRLTRLLQSPFARHHLVVVSTAPPARQLHEPPIARLDFFNDLESDSPFAFTLAAQVSVTVLPNDLPKALVSRMTRHATAASQQNIRRAEFAGTSRTRDDCSRHTILMMNECALPASKLLGLATSLVAFTVNNNVFRGFV